MNRRTIQSLVTFVGFILIAAAIYFGAFAGHGVSPILFVIHYPSLFLVGGGLIGIMLVMGQYDDLCHVWSKLMKRSPVKQKMRNVAVAKRFDELTSIYYKQGVTAANEYVKAHEEFDRHWRATLDRIEARMSLDDVKNLIGLQLKKTSETYNKYITFFNKLSAMGPSFGLFGTVIGLIQLMANLQDFSAIGPSMSLAMVATLYGLFFANIVFAPIIAKLETMKEQEIDAFKNLYTWLTMIEKKKPAFYVADAANLRG